MQVYLPHLDFALALHGRLSERASGAHNVVWSPYSVASALGLAASGARGRTLDELARALAPGGDLAALGRLLGEAAQPAGAEAAVANALWLRHGSQVAGDYRRAALDWPGAALHTADFARDPEGARNAINADVEKTTRELITELLAPGAVDPDVAAVLANALYLRAGWRVGFDPRATVPRPFHTPSGRRQVPTMYQRERLGHAARQGWQLVALPTEGGDVVADVLLPDGDLAASRLTAEILRGLYDAARPVKVDLFLPRVRIEFAALLKEPLQRLGAVTAFDPAEADFTAITADRDDLHISQALHKAVLRLDEAGLEGAAATAVVIKLAAMDLGRPVTVRVDRPFLIVIRHATTGAIYFLARVTEP